MSACCDGSLADDCPCACHDWAPVGPGLSVGPAVPDDGLADWWAEARVAIQASIDQLVALDIFGDPKPLHPLLDPAVPRPELAANPEVPPVDPDRVHFPPMTAVTMDALAGGGSYFLGPMLEGAPVTLEGREVGYVERGQVVVTDYTARRRLWGGEPLGVSIGPVSRDPRERG